MSKSPKRRSRKKPSAPAQKAASARPAKSIGKTHGKPSPTPKKVRKRTAQRPTGLRWKRVGRRPSASGAKVTSTTTEPGSRAPQPEVTGISTGSKTEEPGPPEATTTKSDAAGPLPGLESTPATPSFPVIPKVEALPVRIADIARAGEILKLAPAILLEGDLPERPESLVLATPSLASPVIPPIGVSTTGIDRTAVARLLALAPPVLLGGDLPSPPTSVAQPGAPATAPAVATPSSAASEASNGTLAPVPVRLTEKPQASESPAESDGPKALASAPAETGGGREVALRKETHPEPAQIWLSARDSRSVCAYWDVPSPRPSGLQVCLWRHRVGGDWRSDTPAPAHEDFCFIETPMPGATYFAELRSGRQPAGWQTLAVSAGAATPPQFDDGTAWTPILSETTEKGCSGSNPKSAPTPPVGSLEALSSPAVLSAVEIKTSRPVPRAAPPGSISAMR